MKIILDFIANICTTLRFLFYTGSGIRDEHPGSYFEELNIRFFGKKHLHPDPGSGILPTLDPGSGIFSTLDPGSDMEKSDPGSGIRDKYSASAALFSYFT